MKFQLDKGNKLKDNPKSRNKAKLQLEAEMS